MSTQNNAPDYMGIEYGTPCGQLITAAIAVLEVALSYAPCTGPESDIQEAITILMNSGVMPQRES